MAKRTEKFHYYAAKEGKRAKDVVFSPFTWAGRPCNSDARLQALAHYSGCDVVTAHAAGAGTLFVGGALRKDLRCIFKIGNLAREQGQALAADSRFQDYEGHRIAQGLSARSVWVAAMTSYLSDANQHPFTHVQTCDGINFSTSELPIHAITRLLREGKKRTPDIPFPSDLERKHGRLSDIFTLGCAASELFAYVPVMASRDNVEPHKWLAAKPEIPYHSVIFESGVGGGGSEQITQFHDHLTYLRTAAANGMERPAPLLAETLPYHHGDLMNPIVMAGLLERTVQMTDPEFRIPT